MTSHFPENVFMVTKKWHSGSRKMTSQFPKNDFPVPCKWLPTSQTMTSQFPENDFLIPRKLLPCSQKMTSHFPKNDLPVPGKWLPGSTQFQENDFPDARKWTNCSPCRRFNRGILLLLGNNFSPKRSGAKLRKLHIKDPREYRMQQLKILRMSGIGFWWRNIFWQI